MIKILKKKKCVSKMCLKISCFFNFKKVSGKCDIINLEKCNIITLQKNILRHFKIKFKERVSSKEEEIVYIYIFLYIFLTYLVFR